MHVCIIIRTCVDINECLVDDGGCEFSCKNLKGINNATDLGYQCGCDYGYQLTLNNHDCDGMYVTTHMHIIIHMCNINIHDEKLSQMHA